MDNASRASTARKGAALDGRSQAIAFGIAILSVAVTFGMISLDTVIRTLWCPASTFASGMLPFASGFMMFGVMSTLFSCLLLGIGLQSRYRLIKMEGATEAAPVCTYNKTIVISGLVGLVFGILNCLYASSFYCCMTPTNVIYQWGYPGRHRTLTWNNLSSIQASCWTSHVRGQAPYKGSSLSFAFSTGFETTFSLVDGGRFKMQEYDAFRYAVKRQNYRYTLDRTVTPDACPPYLYTLLRDWDRL